MISPKGPPQADQSTRLGKLLRFFPGSGKEGEGVVRLIRASTGFPALFMLKSRP